MEICINCNKEYTIRGIKLHRKKCDQSYFLVKKKEEEKKEKDSKKIKIIFSYQNNLTLGNYLPDDCIKNIYEYLLLIDKNTIYYKLYENINNVSFVCKNFYINRPDIEYIKDKIIFENKQTICRSWSSNMYGLTYEELESLDYKIFPRRYGTIHLFKIIDVKEFAYNKYGTEYDYNKYLLYKEEFKLLSKKDKEIIYSKRKILYDELFMKYNYNYNHFLNEIYENYIDYIRKNIPRIDTIENKIKDCIDKNKLKEELITELNKNGIKYYETDEVLDYINKIKKYTKDNIIKYLNNRMIKENIYKDLSKNFLDKEEYDLFAYNIINNADKDINILISTINNIEQIKKYIDKNISIKKLSNEKNIENYLDNIIDKWCNRNRNLESYDFINYLDNSIQIKIKTKIALNNILYCFCNNIASNNCINLLCKKCCININCKKHYK